MMTNQDYKNAALNALSGNWAQAIIACVVYLGIYAVCSAGDIVNSLKDLIPAWANLSPSFILWANGIGFVASVLVVWPLGSAFLNSFKTLYRDSDNRVTYNMVRIFGDNWGRLVLGYLLMYIKIILWSLLLIIPGIIKGFAYSMVPYILLDRPELSYSEVIAESERMMKGHKFDLFYLYLSFIGWAVLSVLSLGIGFLWLEPYVNTAVAAFYNDIKGDSVVVERVL